MEEVWFDIKVLDDATVSCEVVQILIRKLCSPLPSLPLVLPVSESYSLSQPDWVTECLILGPAFFWMCLCRCFLDGLTFELV